MLYPFTKDNCGCSPFPIGQYLWMTTPLNPGWTILRPVRCTKFLPYAVKMEIYVPRRSNHPLPPEMSTSHILGCTDPWRNLCQIPVQTAIDLAESLRGPCMHEGALTASADRPQVSARSMEPSRDVQHVCLWARSRFNIPCV